MPEFTTIPIQEAQLRTISGRQGQFINEYADYIQQLPKGQAGRLSIGAEETPATTRRRLGVAAKTLGIPLIIKRSGTDIYFWREDAGGEQPRRKRSYTRRMRLLAEIPTPDHQIDELGMDELGMVEQGLAAEESPELGQTPV